MGGFLDQQFGGRFYPELWTSPFFYLRWFLKLENVVSVVWLALALLGWLVFSSKPTKIFLGSLWLAYLIFGMTFAHHISSHDYYSLPVIPIAALCLGQLAVVILPIFSAGPVLTKPSLSPDETQNPEKHQLATYLQMIYISVLLGSMLLITVDQYLKERTNDYRPQAAFWAQVGAAIGHQPGVLALTTDYGYPLAYYGWQNSSIWPASVDIHNTAKTFAGLTANKSYFLVTDFDEYDLQPDLQKLLNTNYPILAQGRGFIIFDLLHPKK
jgi:hypothetical protein